MKTVHCILAMLPLLIAGTATAIPAATPSSSFTAPLAIENQTPFVLQYMGHNPRQPADSGEKDPDSRLAIAPGSRVHLGYDLPQPPESDSLEGHLNFQIRDTDESFRLHYRITRNNDRKTGARLESHQRAARSDRMTRAFAAGPWRLIDVDMIKRCTSSPPYPAADTEDNDCVFVLSMTPEAAACIQSPSCNGQQYNHQLRTTHRRGPG